MPYNLPDAERFADTVFNELSTYWEVHIVYYPTEEGAERRDFSCRFETFGLKENISGKSLGIDAIDSMINAMMRVDIFLKSSEECKSGEILWIGGFAPDDFGLPWQSAKRC